jgi:hypothetical protein
VKWRRELMASREDNGTTQRERETPMMEVRAQLLHLCAWETYLARAASKGMHFVPSRHYI